MSAIDDRPRTDEKRQGVLPILRRLMTAVFVLGIAAIVLMAGFLMMWSVVPPISTLMLARYVTGRPVVREWVPLDRIAPTLPAAVVMSEDAQFCRHQGVDWKALNDVLENADEDEGPTRGASTLTMQVAKNLFLWPGRSVIRKGLEIPLAMLIDAVWSKRRILEVYFNVAEWGPDGEFGIQAASRRAFGKDASDLSPRDAALLAAVLPNPIVRDPRRPTRGVIGIAARIAGRARGAQPWTDCLRAPASLSLRRGGQ